MIRDSKAVLFGSFSDKLTKKDKTECWKAIHEKCTSLGLVAPNKEWTYSRDVFWQNLKIVTMKKVENRKKTGSAGGPDCKFTDIDKLILDIIGPDNPILCSLGVPETWEQKPDNSVRTESDIGSAPCIDKNIENSTNLPSNIMEKNESKAVFAESSKLSETARKKRKIFHADEVPVEETFAELKKKKILQQITILEKESYLKTLQILKLERELQVPPSKFTESLSTFNYVIQLEESPTVELLNIQDELEG